MPTNVSYASVDTNLESLVLACLPDIGETGDGITNYNGLAAIMKKKGMYEDVVGGLEFWYGILKAESTNGKWQGKNETMNANSQDPAARLRWDPKVYTSSIVINELDVARNRGKAAIISYLEQELRPQGVQSLKNAFNSAFWKGTPATNDPDSIPSIISITPTTGTIGGLTRAGNTYLQNGVYSTNISDLGSEAGIGRLEWLRLNYSFNGMSADILITTELCYAGLVGYLTTERRYMRDDDIAQLGFEAIQLGAATVTFENTRVLGGANTITASYLYGISSKAMKLKHLVDDTGNGWDKTFNRIQEQLNKAIFFRWFGNLCTNCPRAHWVASSVTSGI